MVDRHFADPSLAELYDVFHPCPQRDDLAFYLPLVMAAEAVLDVGCGTGALLRRAREAGHLGRLCGLDPATGMLEQARQRSDIEWHHGELASVDWKREFDLVVMTGHAFQVFVDDEHLRGGLAAIRSALIEDGRFAFETRNPRARAWDRWTPEYAIETTDRSGAVVRMEHRVEQPVDGDCISFTTTYSSTAWDSPRVSHSKLRFLDNQSLRAFLSGAGMTVVEQLGDWTGGPLLDESPEIITIARAG